LFTIKILRQVVEHEPRHHKGETDKELLGRLVSRELKAEGIEHMRAMDCPKAFWDQFSKVTRYENSRYYKFELVFK